MRANGRTLRPTSHSTAIFTASNSSSALPSTGSKSSQASSTAREAFERTSRRPSGNSIACTVGSGATRPANQAGASRPALYGDGGEV